MAGDSNQYIDLGKGNGSSRIESNQKVRRGYSGMQKFLWLLAGSEISVLEKCPNEYNRHANIGLMILITSLFAALTAFVAGNTFVESESWGVIGFALMWALVIFSMDRSMVNSIKKDPEEKNKFQWGYFWPRLVLAIILSFFMSIPLDHIVFAEKIKYQMDQNANDDWHTRQKDLTYGYNILSDSTVFNKCETQSAKLESQINSGCSSCPDEEYITNKTTADNISSQLPSLSKSKMAAEGNFNSHFASLRRSQTPEGESLISSRNVNWDSKLRGLSAIRNTARATYSNKNKEAKDLYAKANIACDEWKARITKEKIKLDTLKDKTRQRLDSNINTVAIKSGEHKDMLDQMKGFDTQFTTLFLMPDWGVQILKWLIFLALLVIEILPTYLKLKTPIGQYDWEMYQRDVETELEVKARIENSKTGIKNIEEYRSKSEVTLNKKVIDKMVIIEEQLANDMLTDWEAKARTQMKNDVDNS